MISLIFVDRAHLNCVCYSASDRLIGRALEARETLERVNLYERPRQVATYRYALKQQAGDRRAPLRRLLCMLQEYPREAFLIAIASAERYRLFDLDRLKKLVLRQITDDNFCVTPGSAIPRGD